MTEKRFIPIFDGIDKRVVGAKDNGKIISFMDMFDLLNDLTEENEELKEDYDYLEKRFKEEEWHYEHIDEDRDVWMHKCHELEKENEQLKKILNELSDMLQFDVENGIRSYPVILSEYLSNALKELQKND